jgi:hypothetical protein
MRPLSVADQFRLRAAEGWLELGNPGEAQAELEGIDPALATHPDVLHLQWQIRRRAKDWDGCFALARTLTETAPEDPRAWTSLAQSYYYSARVQEAYDIAVSKITTFPKHWPLYYDAACYACLTGRLSQAKQFLQLATALGNEAEVLQLAANDPDLKGLWNTYVG